MAIVALKKLTVCGLSSDKLRMLEGLQQKGCAHLIALMIPSDTAGPDASTQFNDALKAIKYLNQCTNKRHQINESDPFDFERTVENVLNIQNRVRQLTDRRDALCKRIKEIGPWGDFILPDEDSLQGLKLWFYCVPQQMMSAMRPDRLVWQQVHKDNLFNYIVVIDRQEPPPSSMPVPRTHVGKIPLSRLKKELNEIELSLEDLQAERESLTRWIGLMAANLARAEDEYALKHAESISIDRDGVFIVQSWIPEHFLAEIKHFFKRHEWAFICEEPGAGENPPTLLKNPEFLSGGEELVNFYHPPGYFGWDPSVVVFFSFAVFFAMILSDAGYAGLFALILAVKWRPLGRSKKGLRLRRLASTTVFFSMVWGVLSGSYFGYSPGPESILQSLKRVDINDFDAMMRLSIAVGVAHIAIANGALFLQRFGRPAALVFLGWWCVVIGGFLLWYARSLETRWLEQTGLAVLITGILLLLFFSSQRAIDPAFDWPRRIFEGLKSLLRLSGLFGDVLSYLRLFALGLSSASMALIFNQLAQQVHHSVEGVGLLLGLLILLLGHALNLALCLMSGVVHGLRLNFIEFYHWGVSDEGYPFRAFTKKEIMNE
ncbi:MAG: V-type ATP synthase subunit I [Gammaproteobacteria bacterium]